MSDQNKSDLPDITGGEEKRKRDWYHNPWMICGAIVCFGPLGLFPLWSRPKTSLSLKIIVSFIVLVATIYMTKEAVNVYRYMADYYQELGEVLK